MHIGSGTDLDTWSRRPAMEKVAAAVGPSVTSSAGGRFAHSLSPGRGLRRSRCLLLLVAFHARAVARVGQAVSSKSSRADISSPKELLMAEIRRSRKWDRTRFIWSMLASTISPGRFSMGPIIRCRSLQPTIPARSVHGAWLVGGPLCESGTFSRKKRGDRGPRACPGRGRRLPGNRVRGRVRLCDGLELQLEAAGRRGPHRGIPARG